MKRKLLVSIIAIIMTVCSLALLVSCDRTPDNPGGADTGDGDPSLLSYTLLKHPLHMAVVGLGSYEGNHLVIPRMYNGWYVEEITSADYGAINGGPGSLIPGDYIMPGMGGEGPVIQKVSMPDTVTIISKYALCNTNIEEIEIGSNVTEISENAFYGCGKLKNISVDPRNQHFKSIDGNLYSKDGKTLIKYASGKTETEFTVPNGVTAIAKRAFQTNQNIEKIIMSDSVTEMGVGAFSRCSNLKSVKISNNVKTIAAELFLMCEKLMSLTIPSGVVSINKGAFFYCDNLTNIQIPNSVTWIETYAFAYCKSLSVITVPSSVTNIGQNAFKNCDNLSSVIFEAPSGWNATSYPSLNNVSFLPNELELLDTAAIYLSQTYVSYFWHRDVNNANK